MNIKGFEWFYIMDSIDFVIDVFVCLGEIMGCMVSGGERVIMGDGGGRGGLIEGIMCKFFLNFYFYMIYNFLV